MLVKLSLILLAASETAVNYEALSKSYAAEGVFYDQYGHQWEIRETWYRDSRYEFALELEDSKTIVGRVSINIPECACSLGASESNLSAACNTGSVLANSPIRQAIARFTETGEQTVVLRDNRFVKVIERVKPTRSDLLIEHLVKYPHGEHTRLSVRVRKEKLKSSDLPQPSRNQPIGAHTEFGRWLEENYYSLGQVLECGGGAMPGVVWASGSPGLLEIVDVVECTTAASSAIYVGLHTSLDGLKICGSRGTDLNLTAIRDDVKTTVVLSRDVAYKKIVFSRGLNSWPNMIR